jgi:hypothetical protein
MYDFLHPRPDFATVDEATNIAIKRFIDRRWIREATAQEFDEDYIVVTRPDDRRR